MKNNNDKNIYDMLNDIEVDLSEYEREDFNDIEKMRIKKKFRKSIGKKNISNSYKKYISVASIAVVSLGIVTLTPVGTYASKIISDLVFDIKTVLGIGTEEEGYIEIINKSVTKEDITVRLNEAILNDDELILSLTTISKENIGANERIWREQAAELYINGELVDATESGSSSQVGKKNIDEVMFFRLDTSKYDGRIDVKLKIDSITRYKEDKDKMIKQDHIEGPFIFEFDFDASKINTDIKNIDINKELDFGNGEKITIDKYVYTPLTQKILYTRNEAVLNHEVDLILKGTDDLGNEIEFDMYHGKNEKGQLIANTTGGKIDKSAKYLTLTAYRRQSGENGTELTEIEKDIKIDLTDNAK